MARLDRFPAVSGDHGTDPAAGDCCACLFGWNDRQLCGVRTSVAGYPLCQRHRDRYVSWLLGIATRYLARPLARPVPPLERR